MNQNSEKEKVPADTPVTEEAQAPDTAPAQEAPAAPQEDSRDTKENKEGKDSKKNKKEKADKADKCGALTAELERVKKELADTKDTYQRMLAEYANYKRRTEQEKEQLGEFTKAEILRSLLPSLDNLERAVDAPAGEEYKKGVDMTIHQFRETLQKMGLEEIEAQNAPFNPEIHNAVMREDADGVEPDTVTEVFQKGYKMGDRILRPAMVKVAN